MMKNLATILIRPRATMRRVLDHVHEKGKDRMILPLVLLTLFTGFLNDMDAVNIGNVAARENSTVVVLVIIAVSLGVLLVMIALFYAFAWLAYMIGRALEGTGTVRDVRSAMAWGLAPMVWSLLYAIPAAIFYRSPEGGGVRVSGETVRFVPTQLGDGCGWWLLFGFLDFAVFIWTIVLMSHTIGEAHRFNSLRGFATLCLLLITPVVIGIAAALSVL